MATKKPKIGVRTTGAGYDLTHGYAGPVLPMTDPVLRGQGGGDLKIYERIKSSPYVIVPWQQRQLALVSKEIEVIAGGERPIDISAADFMRDQLAQIRWDAVTMKMHWGVFYGYAVAGLEHKRDGRNIMIDRAHVHNRRKFRFGVGGELRRLSKAQPVNGEQVDAPDYWHFATGCDHDDDPYGLGLAHWLYWPEQFIRNTKKFWLTFLDKFAMPTAHGEYDDQADEKDVDRLMEALEAIQTDSGIATPKSMQIKLLEIARSGTPDYKTMHDTMSELITRVIIGQTASSAGTPGKLGNDQQQGDVKQEIVKADADLICEAWNLGPARWLSEWNFPGAAVPRVWRVIEDADDLTNRALRDQRIARIGFRPSLDYITNTYGGEWVEAEPLGGGGGDDAAFMENDDAPLPAEQIATRMHAEVRPAVGAWAEQIERLVDDGVKRGLSPQAMKDEMMAAFSELDDDHFANAMAQGLIAAEAAGRSDLVDESE